jgi:hypothetical protein
VEQFHLDDERDESEWDHPEDIGKPFSDRWLMGVEHLKKHEEEFVAW